MRMPLCLYECLPCWGKKLMILFRMRHSINYRGKIKQNQKKIDVRFVWDKIGTLAPPLNSIHRFDNNGHPIYLPPWMSDWLNLNVMVPMIAFIVIIVGILVICIALTRRRVDMRNGQKDVYCRFNYSNNTQHNNIIISSKKKKEKNVSSSNVDERGDSTGFFSIEIDSTHSKQMKNSRLILLAQSFVRKQYVIFFFRWIFFCE